MSKTETRLKTLEAITGSTERPFIVIMQDLKDPSLYHLANQDGEAMTKAEALARYPETDYLPILVTYKQEPIPGEPKP